MSAQYSIVKTLSASWAVVAQAFNPSTQEAEQRQADLCEFMVSMVYKISLRQLRLHKKILSQKPKRTITTIRKTHEE